MPITPGYKPPGYKKPKTYVVRQGDTLEKIASMFGVNDTQLLGVNRGVGQLSAGVVLSIPEPPGLTPTKPIGDKRQTIGMGGKYYSTSNILAGQYQPSIVYSQLTSQRDLTRSGQGVNYGYLGAQTQPTNTVMPDTYNAQLNVPGKEYQLNRFAFFESRGLPVPTMTVEEQRLIGSTDATMVMAGYIKQGGQWVYTNPSTPATPTVGGEGGAQGDFWEYQQWIALQNAQAYGSPNARRRSMKDLLAYKDAKKDTPGLTYREWLMRKSGAWRQANAQYPQATEETIGTPAIQTQYSNSYYSSTGRSYFNTGFGLVSWRGL